MKTRKFLTRFKTIKSVLISVPLAPDLDNAAVQIQIKNKLILITSNYVRISITRQCSQLFVH